MNKKELADHLHNSKYNCAQAVLLAFADEIGEDKEVLFRISEGFGFGAGCGEGICGALSGAIMLAGLKNSDGNLEAPGTKASTYKIAKEMKEKFVTKTGGLICKDLKGLDGGKVLCSCPDCIGYAVEVLEEVLGL